MSYAHRDSTSCSGIALLDDEGRAAIAGTELDWLTFFWDVTTSPPADGSGSPLIDPTTGPPLVVGVSELLEVYASANAAVIAEVTDAVTGQPIQDPTTGQPIPPEKNDLERLESVAPSSLATWLSLRAAPHAVSDPSP